MRVLLTGANGFIGSHLLEGLVERGFKTVILIRHTSDTGFIDHLLNRVEVRCGELRNPASLRAAVEGVEAVLHCAAKTKAARNSTYYAVNSVGTRHVVEACNARSGELRRLVLVSSVAVSGPGTAGNPVTENSPPRPVSHYGRSKMLGERWVRQCSLVPFTIVRPAAVYGPRDSDFFLVFRWLSRGIMPLIDGGRQPLNLVYVRDVVEGVLTALRSREARGETYHLAHPRRCTQREFLDALAEGMGARPVRIFLPHHALYPVCLLAELKGRVTGRAGILNLQKMAEYAAPGWVCATRKAEEELGFRAETPLPEGVRRTYRWYVEQGWIPKG